MEYITIKEVSKKWNMSERRVQEMCKAGKISGVMKFGHEWAIPKDVEKPKDNRIKTGRYVKSKKTDT